MQTNQSVPRPFSVLAQAIAYLLGGVFLLDTTSAYLAGTAALVGQVFGFAFVGFAFFLAISSFVDKLVAWANRIDMWLFLALFFAAMASLIVTAIESTDCRTFYVVLAAAFLSIVLAAMLFRLFKIGASLKAKLGSKAASVSLLIGLSLALSMFALAMVIVQVEIMGGPILYLAMGLVCLGLASLLQRTV